MPFFVAALVGGLIQLAGTLVGRVLIALGFGFVEYAGVSTLIGTVLDAISGGLDAFQAGATAGMLQWAGFLQLDVHLGIIVSAVGVKVLLNSLGGATVRRLVQK